MIPKKIDSKTVIAIRSMLKKLNIDNNRVLIDLEKQTIEAQEDDNSNDDLLEVAGMLSPERGRELLEEVIRSREEWNS